MKKLLSLVLVVSFVAGCVGTPAAKTFQFRQSYVAVLTGLDGLVLANKITPKQAVEIQKLRPIADAAEKAVIALETSGGSSYTAAIDAANAVLAQLIAIELEAKKVK